LNSIASISKAYFAQRALSVAISTVSKCEVKFQTKKHRYFSYNWALVSC